jgi:ADP-heptose:LPS heptosyltransferase
MPEARIDVLVAASKRRLVEGAANVIAWEKRELYLRPWRLVRQLLDLRRTGYEVAIDASHWHRFSLTSALMLAWTGARMRIAHDRGEAREFATHVVPGPEAVEPEIETKLRLLSPLGISRNDARLETPLGREGEAVERMRTFLERSGLLGRRIVALAPGARKRDHRASLEIFRELGEETRKLGGEPLVVWGPGEQELARALSEAIKAVLAPATDLEELAALMRSCAVIITNDTGPMHLAVATAAPTIALFTQADHQRWGHANPPHAVIPGFGRSEAEVLEEAKKALAARLGRSSG